MAWTRKLPSNRWQGLYRDASGRVRTTGTFARRNDAKTQAAEEERSVRRKEWVDPKLAGDFASYSERHMATALHLDPATRDRDQSLLSNHLLPHLGSLSLLEVDTARVRTLVGRLAEELSPSTVALVYQLLGRIMRQAEEDKLIVKAPARVRLPRDTRERRARRGHYPPAPRRHSHDGLHGFALR